MFFFFSLSLACLLTFITLVFVCLFVCFSLLINHFDEHELVWRLMMMIIIILIIMMMCKHGKIRSHIHFHSLATISISNKFDYAQYMCSTPNPIQSNPMNGVRIRWSHDILVLKCNGSFWQSQKSPEWWENSLSFSLFLSNPFSNILAPNIIILYL